MNGPAQPLVVTDLSAGYDGCVLLRGIELTAQPGETWGLLGPNGAGKTTLLRVVSGIKPPMSGRVLLGDRMVHRMAPADRARRIAFVPQGVTIPVPYTVRELVSMGRLPYVHEWAPLGDADERAVDRAIAQVGLTALQERRIHALSAGEHQRALIALALAQEPALLLLDEPTAHLDLHHAWHLMALIREIAAAQHLVVVLSTHDLTLASSFCTRLGLLEQGRLTLQGGREEVLTAGALSRAYGQPLVVTEAGGKCWIHPP
jgi:iron complex transport system ATP-binding protein